MSIALYVFLCYCFRCSENLPANYRGLQIFEFCIVFYTPQFFREFR
jgi:hypothetical protein